MMLVLAVKEVHSLGTSWRSENRAQLFTSSRSMKRKKRKGRRECERGGGGAREEVIQKRLQLWCAWERETVNDRAREFKRHGVCWLAGLTEGERERGKCATAERDKCGRTNRRWLPGSFIHCRDQIQQDSSPYGMAQLIHPITWTTYTTRREGMVCACVCVLGRRCLKVSWRWQ